MAHLHFVYSTMNAGKSIELLKTAHNYEECGKSVLLLTPEVDIRGGVGVIESRIGLKRNAIPINGETDLWKIATEHSPDCVLIDEAQFLSKEHVVQLVRVADEADITVMCFGLKSDFRGEQFEGSYYLMVYADKIEELKTICWCGRKAIFNARVRDGELIRSGKQIEIGGNESYIPLCRKHYMEGNLGK